MTPKEKAYELYIRYLLLTNDSRIAKQCAIIAVDLLVSETFLDFTLTETKSFWQEVKTELEKP